MVSGFNRNIPWINIALLGTSNQGKSTLAGFLLHSLAEVHERVMKAASHAALHRNAPEQKFAFLLDRTPSERAARKTRVNSWWGFTRAGKRYLLIDTPGEHEHILSVIGALVEASAVLLVVDVRDYLNNLPIYEQQPRVLDPPGAIEQIYQKLAIASFLGIRSLGIVLHKMDTVCFAQKEYQQVQIHLEHILNEQGWDMQYISFLPTAINVLHERGYNIVSSCKEFAPWFHGETLIHAIERFIPAKTLANEQLCIQINQKNDSRQQGYIQGIDLLIKGIILAGQVSVGNKLLLQPSGIRCHVNHIESIDCSKSTERAEYWGVQPDAVAGESVCLKCTIVNKTHRQIQVGEIAIIDQPSSTLSKSLHLTWVIQENAYTSGQIPPLVGWICAGYFSTKFRLVQISTDYGKSWQLATKEGLSLTTQNGQMPTGDVNLPLLFEISLKEAIPLEAYQQTPVLRNLLLFDTHWQLSGRYQIIG